MRIRHLVLPAILGLFVPVATPAHAAPACAMVNWSNGDTCTFEAPLNAFVFGGTATAGEGGRATVIVQVIFNGFVIASCGDSRPLVATCQGTAQTPFPTLTHVCKAIGSGGPKAYCVDPPLLPGAGR